MIIGLGPATIELHAGCNGEEARARASSRIRTPRATGERSTAQRTEPAAEGATAGTAAPRPRRRGRWGRCA